MIKQLFIVLSIFIVSFISGADMELLTDYNTKQPVRYAGDIMNGKVYVPSKYTTKQNEFRGIWVATVENIDFKKQPDAETFKKNFIELADNLKRANFTALIFQIRPLNDAFYPSKHNPYSRYLAGKEGVGLPSFDPLKFMIDETHKRGLEFHAWLNPYRVTNGTALSTKDYIKTLDEKNFARRHPEYLLSVQAGKNKNQIILNPGEPAVRSFLGSTVSEIISKYDVDAIHFDDYFYPYADIGNADHATFVKYARNGISTDDWRRQNVDALILGLHNMISAHNKKNKRNVRFGISPFGIWANRTPFASTSAEREKLKNVKSSPVGSLTRGSQSYYTQYADTRRWVREGWIDYVAPQIYWSFSHKVAAYAALADWWADAVKGTNTDLYIGHAQYRPGTLPEWQDPMEIPNQLKYNTLRSEIKGSVMYNYSKFFNPENSLQRNAAKVTVEDFWGGKLPQQ